MIDSDKVYILAVDDQKENLLALNAIFTDPEIELVNARSGKEALRYLMEEREFAVILMDAYMPNMDGFETARAIRGRPKTQLVPIIFLTATHKDSLHAEIGYDIGAVDYIFKPIVPEILRTKVSVFVELFKKNRELKRQSDQLSVYKSELENSLAQLKDVNKSLMQLASIVESSNDAIVSKDLNGIILSWNKAAENIFGYSEKDLIGKSANCLIPSDKLQEDADFLEKLKNGIKIQNYETVRLTKSGDMIDVSLSVSPINDAFGKVIGISAIARDISERKHYEQELKESKEEMELLNKSLMQAKDQAVRASKLKSDFVANMSHELRTPMNGIIGMCTILLDTNLNEKQEEYAKAIQDAGNTLLTVVNDVLDFSKIEAGHLNLECLEFDPIILVEGVCQLLSSEAKKKNLALLPYIDPVIPRKLRGDSDRLKQILTNLIGNAIKFSETGEIVVKVTAESITTPQAMICFSVVDTGIGMTEEEMQRLFQPFVQADSSISRRFGGTGLGLSICKRLVDIMNGDLGVESTKGEGSRFWFKVPLEVILDNQIEVSEDRIRKLKILIIDDEPYASRILEKYLASWGMQSVSVSSGIDAMKLIEKSDSDGDFDVAIVDLNMENMNGLELANEISKKKHLNTKMILLTASPSKELKVEAKKLGFSGFLAKPIIKSQLLNCITEITRTKSKLKSDDSIQSLRPSNLELGNGRILIVDDYPINQQVVKIFLEDWNISCHAVSNGIEALDALNKENYSLILMDCQMPEMDGFTATSAIRERETLSGTHTPIIAMTAYAMSGDRERCLEAGMDDYISKPVDRTVLRKTIEKWLSLKIENKIPDTKETEIMQLNDSKLFSINKLRSRVGEQGALYLINSFLTNSEEYISSVVNAVKERNKDQLSDCTHGISGVCAVLCADGLQSMCKKLITCAKHENWNEAEQAAQDFVLVMGRTSSLMKAASGEENET